MELVDFQVVDGYPIPDDLPDELRSRTVVLRWGRLTRGQAILPTLEFQCYVVQRAFPTALATFQGYTQQLPRSEETPAGGR